MCFFHNNNSNNSNFLYLFFQGKYGNDPVKLYEYFCGVVYKLRELVHNATSVSINIY